MRNSAERGRWVAWAVFSANASLEGSCQNANRRAGVIAKVGSPMRTRRPAVMAAADPADPDPTTMTS